MAQIYEKYNYDIYQQAYCLSILSNCVGGERDTASTLEDLLATRVQKFIGEIPGEWKVAYGPCVYKTDEKPWEGKVQGPENAWFAARSNGSDGDFCVML